MERVTPATFATVLDMVLKTHNITAKELAERVGCGTSYISLLRADKRIPSSGRDWAVEISTAMSLSTDETQALIEAQAYSRLRGSVRIELARPMHGSHEKQLRPLFETMSKPTNHQDFEQSALPWQRSVPRNATAMLRKIPSAVSSAEAALDWAVYFLENLPAPDETNSAHTILLTSQARDTFETRTEFQRPWLRGIANALNRGWSLKHIVRLENDVYRTAGLVKAMLSLIGDAYEPMRFDGESGVLVPAHDVLIVPKVGALMFLGTSDVRGIGGAIYTRDSRQIILLERYWELLAHQGKPLLEAYDPTNVHQYDAWLAQLAAIEEQPGERRLLKHGLSVVTRPPAWYEPTSSWARRNDVTGENLETYRQRVAAFSRYTRTYIYRDIVTIQGLRAYLREGVLDRDDRPPHLPAIKTEPYEVREHITYLIKILENPAYRYELAILEDERDMPARFWEVKGSTVMIEAWRPNGKEVDAAVYDPILAQGFLQAFDERFERIPLKRRYDVADWLGKQLKAM